MPVSEMPYRHVLNRALASCVTGRGQCASTCPRLQHTYSTLAPALYSGWMLLTGKANGVLLLERNKAFCFRYGVCPQALSLFHAPCLPCCSVWHYPQGLHPPAQQGPPRGRYSARGRLVRLCSGRGCMQPQLQLPSFQLRCANGLTHHQVYATGWDTLNTLLPISESLFVAPGSDKVCMRASAEGWYKTQSSITNPSFHTGDPCHGLFVRDRLPACPSPPPPPLPPPPPPPILLPDRGKTWGCP